jgi:peptidoglycan hydrolase-like protein with peptidoglycan-binding domain
MELIAFTHAAVAYEDPTPTPQLRSFDTINLEIPSSAWIGLLSATVFAAYANPAQALNYYGYGDYGVAVEEIQAVLADLDYFDGDITGDFDADTEAALIDFQNDEGLYVDGVAGEDTLTALGLDGLIGGSADVDEVDEEVVVPEDGTLRLGSEGTQVEELQAALADEGYYAGEIDGVFGDETLDAVISFQDESGLEPDGIVGTETLDALGLSDGSVADGTTDDDDTTDGVSTSGTTLQYGDQGSLVEELQSALADEGYYFGDIDGVFADETLDAVLAYQEDNDLTVDGIVGVDTLEALGLSGTESDSLT